MSDTTALSTKETEMESVQFPKYDRYKDSGAEWLGEVPEHWNISTIRAVTELKSDKNQPDLPVLSVYREYGVILKDSRDDNHNATSLDTSTYKAVKEGDLVVNKMKAWQGSMGVSEHEGIVSPAYITCRVKQEKMLPKYLHYLLRSKPFIGVYNAISYGVRVGQWDMRYEDFKKVLIVEPPANEMTRIVSFIDEKTAEIDAAIAKKKTLIQLLNEQKAILINRAVTKGLNSNVKMKDSGVTWIGEVPDHWEVKRVKHMAKFHGGGTPHKETPEFWGGDIPWVSPKDMKKRYISTASDSITETALKRTTVKILPKNVVLIVVRGMILARKIPVALATEQVVINQDMKAMEIKSSACIPEYFVMLLEGVNSEMSIMLDEAGHGTKTLPTEKLGNFQIAMPPQKEQRDILKFTKQHDVEFKQVHSDIS